MLYIPLSQRISKYLRRHSYYLLKNLLKKVALLSPVSEKYYLPECWLNFGGENHLTVSLRPTTDGTEIRKAEVVPVTLVAEKRGLNHVNSLIRF